MFLNGTMAELVDANRIGLIVEGLREYKPARGSFKTIQSNTNTGSNPVCATNLFNVGYSMYLKTK